MSQSEAQEAPAIASESPASSADTNLDELISKIQGQVGEEHQPPAMPEPLQEAPAQPDPMNKMQEFERLADIERETFRQRKLNKDQQAKFDEERETWQRERDELSGQFRKKNPSKWLQSQGVSIKELADGIMNEQENDGTAEQDKISYEEALEKAMDNMEGRFEEMYDRKRGAEQEKHQEEEAYTEFLGSINEHISGNVEQFPSLSSFGGSQEILNQIEKEYNEIEDQYDEEYAERWLSRIDINEYASKYEKTIADNLRDALQLPQLRNLVVSFLQEQQEGQNSNRDSGPRDSAPRTLTKNDFAGGSAPVMPENMTEQDRINAAIEAAKKRMSF